MTPGDPMAEMLRRAQAGDRAAFEGLFLEHRKRLGSVIFFRLGAVAGGKVEVDDILQETSVRALESLGKIEWKGKESFFAWLRTIAEHAILEVAAREKRRPTVALDSQAPAHDTEVSRQVQREERFERLKQALDALSPDHRKVILLAKIQRVPVKDIALEMGRSQDAVSNILARALARLRESFGDTDSLHLPDWTLEP
jgi:RNA polymerase sigma-70 factor, ECF subfamily